MCSTLGNGSSTTAAVNRASHQDGGPRKRMKLTEHSSVHFVPPTNADDEVSYGCNLELLKTEMGKAKPRMDVLKDMMRRTFLIDGRHISMTTIMTYTCLYLHVRLCTLLNTYMSMYLSFTYIYICMQA